MTVINVGAAEGYYAVGMAIRCPGTTIVAFESLAEGRDLIRQMARLNAVEQRVFVSGLCDMYLFNEMLGQMEIQPERSLLIMDIEGGEESLLKPAQIPGLKRMHIVLELHDCWSPGLDVEIKSRFTMTHRIKQIPARARTIQDLPVHTAFVDPWLLPLTNEHRPEGMSWLYMEPLPGKR